MLEIYVHVCITGLTEMNINIHMTPCLLPTYVYNTRVIGIV